MQEIIFDKSRKNLKKVFNRLAGNSIGRYVNREEVLFLAIGGYNRTFELLLAMGLEREDISTFSNLTLSTNFIQETHMKKVLYIKKINYLTNVNKNQTFTKKMLDLNVADGFEESLMIYKHAIRKVKIGRDETSWVKPTVVILDDQSLNLQFDGHRFNYQNDIGFVQMRNRNADPYSIIKEIKDVDEADRMMFALYQSSGVDETEILDTIERLRIIVDRNVEGDWYMKPTEFKKAVGSNELASAIREVKELGITQLTSNKKIGKENARWVIIPNQAFEFKGFDYKDEAELFEEEIATEENAEMQYALEQEKLLNDILFEEFSLNIKLGYVGNAMQLNETQTLHSFLADIDGIESEYVNGVDLLDGATTEKEYKHIKKYNLAYFLDGTFKDNERKDENYLGGKRLISIDVDDGDYSRQDIENKLETQGLFGIVYPTAKYYFDQSARWRIVLMADKEMNKDNYKAVVEGVSRMLNLEIDDASLKISQLMGYPLAQKDVSTVIGTMVNVAQFKVKTPVTKSGGNKVVEFKNSSGKSLLDFDHAQARLAKEALEYGIPQGRRNESYRQIIMYLRDTVNNESLKDWHEEAQQLELAVRTRMAQDGLDEEEMELICR